VGHSLELQLALSSIILILLRLLKLEADFPGITAEMILETLNVKLWRFLTVLGGLAILFFL
jgi:hypothetical protein